MPKFAANSHAAKLRCADEAISEIERELHIRYRCYERWIKDGKLSDTDAIDRIDRLETAVALLQAVAARENGPIAPVVLPTPPTLQSELIDDSHRRALEA